MCTAKPQCSVSHGITCGFQASLHTAKKQIFGFEDRVGTKVAVMLWLKEVYFGTNCIRQPEKLVL